MNESTGSILNRLEDTHLISTQEAVRDYLVYTGLDTQLQAGKFVLSPAMTSIEILNTLLDSTPQFVTVNILPGWRLEEIAENIPTTGLNITANEFLQAAHSPPDWAVLEFDLPSGSSLEGFLLPGSYELPRESGPDELLETILEQFNQRVTIDIRDGIQRQGLTLYEGVTIASIVERENIIPDEMPIIASVFLNRIEIGM
ncbi:MAG: endolytic transglycosylase MltG, partial [Anaerolineales bacterium]